MFGCRQVRRLCSVLPQREHSYVCIRCTLSLLRRMRAGVIFLLGDPSSIFVDGIVILSRMALTQLTTRPGIGPGRAGLRYMLQPGPDCQAS